MNQIHKISFLCSNLIKLSSMNSIAKSEKNGIVIRGCSRSDIKQTENIYKKLNSNGKGFSRIQELLIRVFGEKFLFIAKSDNQVVGLDFYYINHRDREEQTIHEGFIGVLPEFEGQGIATRMRTNAKDHFKKSGFLGISSRISKNNLASLRSAEKMQFVPVEEYFDERKNEDRYYLVCNLGEQE